MGLETSFFNQEPLENIRNENQIHYASAQNDL